MLLCIVIIICAECRVDVSSTHFIQSHSWRPLNIFDHLKSKCPNMNHIESWNSGKTLPTCPLQTIRTIKTSLHFVSMMLRPHWWQIIFLSFSKVCCGRGLSLHLPSWRRDRGISRVPSEAETKEMWRAYQVCGVWCVVPSVPDCAGGGRRVNC